MPSPLQIILPVRHHKEEHRLEDQTRNNAKKGIRSGLRHYSVQMPFLENRDFNSV